MNQDIDNEIQKLKSLKQKWGRQVNDKGKAASLILEVERFLTTMWKDFPNAASKYKKNQIAEIAITDGLEDLKRYADSNLKIKDNHYSFEGVQHISRGLSSLISSLEREL